MSTSRRNWIKLTGLSLTGLSVAGLPLLPALSRAEDKTTGEKPAWKSLFDGKSLDGWKITEFGTQGEIIAENGILKLGVGDGCSGVTITQEFPKADYEVRVEASRVDGSDFFCGLTFPVGEDPCSLIIGGWGGSLCGLSSIDGKDAARNDTRRFVKFDKGTWYTVRLRVTKSRIITWIDDRKIIDRYVGGQKLTIRPEVSLSKPFGICSWNTTAAIRKVELRPLTTAEIEANEAPLPVD